MVEVSIISLIYKSKKLADWIYESVIEFTPMIKQGTAEFFFVANDPTDDLLNHLITKKYPFILNENEKLSDEELFKKGYGAPEYMSRVYKGYNKGIINANGNRVVLVNSDNYFSPDWLENLLKYSDYKKVITSTLIEPGHIKHGVFPGAINKNFGNKSNNFKKSNFLQYVNKIKTSGLKSGGAYMPCLLYKNVAIYAGLYPEGNIRGEKYEDIKKYGDEYFFQKLNELGVIHFTSKDSLVYHLKEGEKDEPNGKKIKAIDVKKRKKTKKIKEIPSLKISNLNTFICHSPNHNNIIKKMLSKVSIILLTEKGSKTIYKSVKSLLDQTHENIEIIVINNGNEENKKLEKFLSKFPEKIKYFKKEKGHICWSIDFGIEQITGEYFCWLNHYEMYEKNKIEEQFKLLSNVEDDFSIAYCSSYDDDLINSSTMLIPKHAIKKSIFFDENFKNIQDLEKWKLIFPKYNFLKTNDKFVKNFYLNKNTKVDHISNNKIKQNLRNIFYKVDKIVPSKIRKKVKEKIKKYI